jgi:hypothetical protein
MKRPNMIIARLCASTDETIHITVTLGRVTPTFRLINRHPLKVILVRADNAVWLPGKPRIINSLTDGPDVFAVVFPSRPRNPSQLQEMCWLSTPRPLIHSGDYQVHMFPPRMWTIPAKLLLLRSISVTFRVIHIDTDAAKQCS